MDEQPTGAATILEKTATSVKKARFKCYSPCGSNRNDKLKQIWRYNKTYATKIMFVLSQLAPICHI